MARVDGKLRLAEGLAMPREEEKFKLTHYNTNTCWIQVNRLLAAFRLTRGDLADEAKVTAAIRMLAARMPTYITLKEVKKHWGHGQEDVFPMPASPRMWPALDTRLFRPLSEAGRIP